MNILKVAVATGAAAGLLCAVKTAEAGTITSAGAVVALTNINQMTNVVGHGNFDEGPTSGIVPANVYSA
jgi:hypothetical protein